MAQSFFFLAALVTLCVLVVETIPHFDDETYQKLLLDSQSQVKTVYTSYAGITTSRASALISFFSSCVIILIILRSTTKLSTSYHRIIFGMSVADVFQSLAVFCSTWAMPKDMIYRQFEGAVLGNSATCTAQGFAFFTGVNTTLGFNAILCLYYVCIITFKISEERFRKCFEPVLFSLAICFPVLISSRYSMIDKMLPTPNHFNCVPTPYPYWCVGEESDFCVEGYRSSNTARLFLLGIYITNTLTIFSAMILVCRTVYCQGRAIKKYINVTQPRRYINASQPRRDQNNRNSTNTVDQFQYETKTVIFQTLGYLGAFMLCQLFPLASVMSQEVIKNKTYQQFHVVLRPLQGLFNLIIFMGHKVCNNMRRSNSDLTRWQAFCKVLDSSQEEPTLFLSNINIVGDYNTDCAHGDDISLDASFPDVY